MNTARTLRLAAAGLVILAIALAALQLRHPPQPDRPAPSFAPARLKADASEAELARCQGLGEAGARDGGCLAAWAESRRRVLGLTPDPTEE